MSIRRIYKRVGTLEPFSCANQHRRGSPRREITLGGIKEPRPGSPGRFVGTTATRLLAGIIRLQRYYEPLRHPRAAGLSLTGIRLIIPVHAMGLPVLRALSLCTCCRHYPGAADGRSLRSSHPTVSAFPGSTSGSACTSSFSRFAQRSLALRPAHSHGHRMS